MIRIDQGFAAADNPIEEKMRRSNLRSPPSSLFPHLFFSPLFFLRALRVLRGSRCGSGFDLVSRATAGKIESRAGGERAIFRAGPCHGGGDLLDQAEAAHRDLG